MTKRFKIYYEQERNDTMLKQKSIWKVLTLMMTLLLGSAINTYAATPHVGYFDQMEGDTIVGWGWDPSMPNTAVPVHITVTNQQTAEVVGDFHQTAAIHRDDLEDGNIGNGNHGFRIKMNWDSLTDGVYVIEGWVGEVKIPSTQTYTKGAVQNVAAPADEIPAAITGMISLGVFRTTAYCPCSICSEGWGRKTATGAIAKANHTIAVDPRVIPYGSKVMINGVVYTAEDRGGAVKGNHIDIFYDTHSQSRQHGVRTAEVFLIS